MSDYGSILMTNVFFWLISKFNTKTFHTKEHQQFSDRLNPFCTYVAFVKTQILLKLIYKVSCLSGSNTCLWQMLGLVTRLPKYQDENSMYFHKFIIKLQSGHFSKRVVLFLNLRRFLPQSRAEHCKVFNLEWYYYTTLPPHHHHMSLNSLELFHTISTIMYNILYDTVLTILEPLYKLTHFLERKRIV